MQEVTWENVRWAMEMSGMTASQFAKGAGVSALSIGLVKNHRPIPETSVTKLSRAIERVMTGKEEEE